MKLTRCQRDIGEENGIPFELCRFTPQDAVSMLDVVPYPNDEANPVGAWWERRDVNFTLMVGRRGGDGKQVGEAWERDFNNTNHARQLQKIAPLVLGAGRAIRVTWEPVAEGEKPSTLRMRVVQTDDTPPKVEGDNYDAWSEQKLRTYAVTHKVKGVTKGMLPADIIAQIRLHNKELQPA